MIVRPRRKAIVFANTRSGRARSLAHALKRLDDAGIDVTTVRLDLTREVISEVVRQGKEEGVQMVIAFGGDGTAGSLVDGLVGMDVTLGVVAAGTSNNFARSLGITPGVDPSVDAIAYGREAPIDVGRVNGHHFAHAAIMGLNVEFARQAQRLRPVLGRLSYPVASLVVYSSRKKLLVRIEGSASRDLQTYQVALLTSREYGRGLRLDMSGIDLQDHHLRIWSVEDLRLRTVVRGLPQIFTKRHLGLPGALGFKMEEGTIVTEEPVPITLDGEIKTQTPARFSIIPNALRVIVSAGGGGKE